MRKLDNKGAMSIIMVIVIVLCVTVAKGIINITQNTLALNEVQGTLDMIGMNSLRSGVDERRWLDEEEIYIDEGLVYSKHNQLFNQLYAELGDQIIDIELDNIYLHEPSSLEYKRLGIPEGERDQYFLEATVRVYLPRDEVMGSSSTFTESFYNFFKGVPGMSASKFHQTTVYPYDDKTNAYEIRSISRLVLR